MLTSSQGSLSILLQGDCALHLMYKAWWYNSSFFGALDASPGAICPIARRALRVEQVGEDYRGGGGGGIFIAMFLLLLSLGGC